MKSNRYVIVFTFILTLVTGCTGKLSIADDSKLSFPPAALLPSTAATDEQTLHFLQRKIMEDPEDFIAQNKLAGWHLQHVRETGDLTSLEIATRAAQASLATLPPEHNTGALALLAQAEFTAHEFAASREHAERLVELEPGRGYPFEILGDALLELGDYEQAEIAFRAFQQADAVQGLTRVAVEQRLSRLAFLHGDQHAAERHMLQALRIALTLPVPPRETVAWCRWQMGELAFNAGKYAVAEQHYRDTLTTVPGYFRAIASLARVRAARGDLTEAITQYEHAINIIPDPYFVAALGDLYKLVGRDRDAEKEYKLFEAISRLSVYSRQQAMFYADHALRPQEAFSIAMNEYSVRKDIYGADAVAWTALKAGMLREAQSAVEQALRLGTQDAKLFYHAAEIARAANDFPAARNYLKRASTLNPEFDLIQGEIMKKSYSGLETAP